MPEKKQATVSIVNESSYNIRKAYIVHKYSNVYKEKLELEDIAPGVTKTSSDKVSFNVGFMTTGADWWYLCFETSCGKLFHSNPNNFRNMIDFMEGLLISLGEMAGESDKKKGKAVSLFSERFFNQESTDGFKKHTLMNGETFCKVIIKNDFKIVLQSNNDKSETVYSKIDVKQEQLG